MKRSSAFFLLLLSICAAHAQDFNQALRAELLAMREKDQKARAECAKGSIDEQIKCYVETAEKIDRPHTRRLEEIFARHGFPSAKLVGKDGVDAFMLLLQHAPDDRLREKCAKPIKKALKRGDVSSQDYANFIDRLLVHQGKPQIYGTNFETKNDKLVMSRTKDLKNLDRRRARIGLPPIAEYVRILREIYKLEVELPNLH